MGLVLTSLISFGELPTQPPIFPLVVLWQTILFNTSKPKSMLVNENNSMPYMKSLATCMNRMIADGYTEGFKITDAGLVALNHQRTYQPEEIEVVNFFRFEGMSDPDDNAVLYVIKTNDEVKGILIDAYGIYNDPQISRFMKRVENIQKKVTNNQG